MPTKLRTSEGKAAGTLSDGVFRKVCQFSKHLIRRPFSALAVDAHIWDAQRSRIDCLEITDTETGCIYRISAERFDKVCVKLDRGYGQQYAAALNQFSKSDPNSNQTALF